MFASGMGAIADSYFGAATMLIAIPTGVKIFNWIATMWGGQIRLATPMLFAISFIMLFTIGGISGVMHASPPTDLQQTDTYFVVAHFHYVLFGGGMMGIFSGIYYWWPKVFGRLLNEALGKWHFWLAFLGMNLTFFPMHFILGMSTLFLIYNIWHTARHGERATKNPWGAATLEWAVSSPPPVYNFSVIPVVRSRLPLWNENGVNEIPDEPPEPVHVPNGSYWPALAAMGLVTFFTGALARSLIIAAAGAVVLVVSIFKWAFEPFEM
jgi:cytochrome c oxidase subunit 1